MRSESHYSGFNSTAALWIFTSQKRLMQLPVKTGAVTHKWEHAVDSLWAGWLISQRTLSLLQTKENCVPWCCLTSEWCIKQQDAVWHPTGKGEEEWHVVYQERWAEKQHLFISRYTLTWLSQCPISYSFKLGVANIINCLKWLITHLC